MYKYALTEATYEATVHRPYMETTYSVIHYQTSTTKSSCTRHLITNQLPTQVTDLPGLPPSASKFSSRRTQNPQIHKINNRGVKKKKEPQTFRA
jgi:hypothetical protein